MTKGFHGSGNLFQGWFSAAENYNGGGAAKHGLNYSGPIQTMVQNSTTPTIDNYTKLHLK